MDKKLESIIEATAKDLRAFADEKEDDILDAQTAAEREAKDQETTPKFKLGFTITLDLKADTMQTALGWSVHHKVSREVPIPDPKQPTLPLKQKGQ